MNDRETSLQFSHLRPHLRPADDAAGDDACRGPRGSPRARCIPRVVPDPFCTGAGGFALPRAPLSSEQQDREQRDREQIKMLAWEPQVPPPLAARPVGARADGRLARTGGLADDEQGSSMVGARCPGLDANTSPLSPRAGGEGAHEDEACTSATGLRVRLPSAGSFDGYLRATQKKAGDRHRGTAKQQAASQAARLWCF